MARRQFLVIYSDGSRKYVSREDRDSMLLAGEIKQTAHRQYNFIAPIQIFRRTATANTLNALALTSATPVYLRRFLEGSFIFELGDKRYHELLETPEGMQIRLATACGKSWRRHGKSLVL